MHECVTVVLSMNASFSPYFSLDQRVVHNYIVSYSYNQSSLLIESDKRDVLFYAVLMSGHNCPIIIIMSKYYE